uniref:Uncharacterized protein n=1 Tax=Araucaria cunninghamii TaxID=56994 RepID=A0A0D6R660_ARACU
MEKALTKASSFWISKRAKKELSSIGDDLNSFTNTVEGGAKWIFNKLKGKMQKPLPELLQDYDLPPGIFPKNATNYDFDEVRTKLTVYIPSVCEVGFKDSSVVRYATRVTGFLLRGKLTGIEGMKTKVVIWTKVTTISVDGPRSSKVHFTAGVKKSRPRDAYEVLRDGVTVDEF